MARKQEPEPTEPGDTIEVSITSEVKDKKGRSLWAKAGLITQHRDGETSEEAWYRAQDFVIGRVDDLVNEYLS